MLEALRAESREGFLERGQQAPSPQLGGLGERCKLGSGALRPRKILNLVNLGT